MEVVKDRERVGVGEAVRRYGNDDDECLSKPQLSHHLSLGPK